MDLHHVSLLTTLEHYGLLWIYSIEIILFQIENCGPLQSTMDHYELLYIMMDHYVLPL